MVEIILALTPYWEEKKLPVVSSTGISDDSTIFCLAVCVCFFCKALGLKFHFLFDKQLENFIIALREMER